MKNKIMTAVVALLLLVIAAAAFFLLWDRTTLTNEMVYATLESASELTAAELTYSGVIYFSEGKIPGINKKSFAMLYVAEVEAGIDFSEVEAFVTDKYVNITIPHATVGDITVDPESIKFFDEKDSLFNKAENEDAVKSISMAVEDIRKNADLKALCKKADEQTKEIFKNFVSNIAEEREIVVNYK